MQAEQNMSFEELFAEARPAFSLLISAHAPLAGFWTMLLAIVVAGSLWYCSKCWYQQQAFNLTDVMTSLDIMAEPVILMSHHTIAFVNNATLTTFGYDSKAELVGKHVSILMQQKEAIAHDSFVGRYEETGQRRVIGKPRVVRGRCRDGSSVSLTLSVSPCATPGHYVGILYPRSEMEARIKMEAELIAKTNELLESDIERLKLQVLAGAPITPAAVVRDAKVVEAWTGSWTKPVPCSTSYPDVKFSCLAACPDALGNSVKCRWLHRGRSLGEDIVELMPGSHAFVKVHNEAFLRLSPLGTQFGTASGHPQLADEKPVLYAGEVEMDQHGLVLRWSNLSGTYRADDTMCFQTGLPLDKFWAVQNGKADEAEDPERYMTTSRAVLLHRVLAVTDKDLLDMRHEWEAHMQSLYQSNPKAYACYQRIQESKKERYNAVGKYGYLTHVKPPGQRAPALTAAES